MNELKKMGEMFVGGLAIGMGVYVALVTLRAVFHVGVCS